MTKSARDMPAFVLGNCPRLPVEALDCLYGHMTIGVNRILQVFTPVVQFWMDQSVYLEKVDGRKYGDLMEESDCVLVCGKEHVRNQGHVGLKMYVGEPALIHVPQPHEVCNNGNTGCAAARWVASMGYDPIYLVGMSATYDSGKTSFYGDNPHHHHRPEDQMVLPVMQKELKRLLADLGDRVCPINTGQALREVADEYPRLGHDVWRATILMEIDRWPK